jgi:hypothetical protein
VGFLINCVQTIPLMLESFENSIQLAVSDRLQLYFWTWVQNCTVLLDVGSAVLVDVDSVYSCTFRLYFVLFGIVRIGCRSDF